MLTYQRYSEGLKYLQLLHYAHKGALFYQAYEDYGSVKEYSQATMRAERD